MTFLCKKLYQHRFEKEGLAEEIQNYYKTSPAVYPSNANGNWQTHYMFIGEIIDVDDKR